MRSFTLRNFIEEAYHRRTPRPTSSLRSFTLRNFIEDSGQNPAGDTANPHCEALRFATSLRTARWSWTPCRPCSLRSFTLRNFIEDYTMTDATPLMDYCEALRFATSLRNDRRAHPADRGRGYCEALRFATSLRKSGRCHTEHLAELRSFTLRNFIEDYGRGRWIGVRYIAKLYASQLH